MDREQKKQKSREYYYANREKMVAQSKAYKEAHKEELRQYRKENYQANREQEIQKTKEWKAAHPESVNRTQRKYNAVHREEVNEKRRAYNEAHSEERNRRQRAYNEANRERLRGYRLKKNYGLSLEEWDALYAKQNGCCAICKQSFETIHKLKVDHCHDTGNVRGLLCSNCNSGMGLLKDDITMLQAAIEYLTHNKCE